MSRPRVTTGQAWMHEIPDDWEVVPAKKLFSNRREPNTDTDVHLTPSQMYGVLPQSEYMAATGGSVVQNIEGQDSMKHVEPDDFIIHLRSFQGGIERSTYTGKVSTAYTVLVPGADALPEYFRWVLKSSAYIQELRTTTNQLRDGQSIKYGDFSKVALPLPPLDEQRAIADYLDRETARIDKLIEEQQRLIVLACERRSALVTAGVTGQIDPCGGHHSRRNSIGRVVTGSSKAWLGQLPESWKVTPAKAAFGERREPCSEGDVHLTPSQLHGVLPQTEYMKVTGNHVVLNLEGQENMKHVEPDDFIIHLRSFQGGLERSTISGKVSTAYVVLRPGPKVVADFFKWLLKSDGYIQELRTTTNQLRDGQSIRYRDFAKVPLPLPPLEEQRVIAEHLDEQTAKIDALIAATETFIELSRERRAALITAAVTGQIDVREVA